MRLGFSIISAILVSGLVWASSLEAGEKFTRVVLDPGHGGRDPGSSGFGLVEKHLTLDLAQRVEKILVGKGISVDLTRRTDDFVEFEERARIVNASPETILVSLARQ
jgi:N-acetylmuramoyl-L-alanine amidase